MSGERAVRRILVAADFDDPSAAAIRLGGALGTAFGAAVTVVHATSIELPPYFTEAQADALERDRIQARATGAADLRAFTAAQTDADVEILIEEGPADEVILRLAPGFDLLVLGTNRRRGAPRWWLGSVAEAVVRGAPVPVAVTPVGRSRLTESPPRATVVAPEAAAPEVEAWVSALQQHAGVRVARTPSLATCAPDRLEQADLVIVPMAGDGADALAYDRIGQVLRQCSRPVLFVPAAAAEASSSG